MPTLPRKTKYGAYDIGGGIGLKDIFAPLQGTVSDEDVIDFLNPVAAIESGYKNINATVPVEDYINDGLFDIKGWRDENRNQKLGGLLEYTSGVAGLAPGVKGVGSTIKWAAKDNPMVENALLNTFPLRKDAIDYGKTYYRGVGGLGGEPSQFRIPESGKTRGSLFGSSEPDVASTYTKGSALHPNINPFHVDKDDFLIVEPKTKGLMWNELDPDQLVFKDSKGNELDLMDEFEMMGGQPESTDSLAQAAKSAGYKGIEIKGIKDFGPTVAPYTKKLSELPDSDVVAVFDEDMIDFALSPRISDRLKNSHLLQKQADELGIDVEDLIRRRRNRAAKVERAIPQPVSKPIEVDEGYQMAHRPAGRDYGASADDLEEFMPDVYTKGLDYYGTGADYDMESIRAIQKAQGSPNALLTIYRAVPKDVNKINKGDWVTTSKSYAKEHGLSNMSGDYKIISKKVKAKDIFNEGNSIHEWGFDPE